MFRKILKIEVIVCVIMFIIVLYYSFFECFRWRNSGKNVKSLLLFVKIIFEFVSIWIRMLIEKDVFGVEGFIWEGEC